MNLPIVTNSQLKAFRACPRRHHFEYNLRIRPVETAEPLRFGHLTHVGLEAWWRSVVDPDEALQRAARLDAAITAMQDVDHDPMDFALAQVLFEGYEARWGEHRYEVLAVEQEFRCTLRNPDTGACSRTFELAGKADAIVRDQAGRILLVEHKTASGDIGPGSEYWRRLAIDGQVSIYFEGAKSLGFEVAGCLYDVIGKPRHRPLTATPAEARKYTKAGALYASQRAQDETLEEFKDRLRGVIAERPDDFYQRGEVVRLEGELADAAYDTWVTARMIREAQVANRHPRNPDACAMWGRTCPYFDVCTGAASLDDETRFRVADTAHEELAA